MAWRRSGDKPLSDLMIVSLLTHICVTRPQWVKVMDCCLKAPTIIRTNIDFSWKSVAITSEGNYITMTPSKNKQPDGLTELHCNLNSRPRNGAFGAHNWNTLKIYSQWACKTRMMGKQWKIFEKMTEYLIYDLHLFLDLKWPRNLGQYSTHL